MCEIAVPRSAEQAFLQYRDMVYRLAVARLGSGAAAEDVVQEVFLRYVRTTPVFAEAEHCKAWLLRTAINCCRSFKTSAWSRRTVPLTVDVAVRMRERSEIYYAVLQLPPEHRTVIHLFYYEGYAVREIAELTDTREATVKTRLHRARQKLRELLDNTEL